MKDVRFLDEALEEFLDQVAYYEERERGLGERFRLAVQAATTGRPPGPRSRYGVHFLQRGPGVLPPSAA